MKKKIKVREKAKHEKGMEKDRDQGKGNVKKKMKGIGMGKGMGKTPCSSCCSAGTFLRQRRQAAGRTGRRLACRRRRRSARTACRLCLSCSYCNREVRYMFPSLVFAHTPFLLELGAAVSTLDHWEVTTAFLRNTIFMN